MDHRLGGEVNPGTLDPDPKPDNGGDGDYPAHIETRDGEAGETK